MTNTVNALPPQAQVKGGAMKAVRLYEYGGPENLKFEVDVPEPTLGADSVLVEAAATSVNPIDWKSRSGARQKDVPLTLRCSTRGGRQYSYL
jgi:NADPH:quinone reductase-like Zn-dependent oxidoreductase